MLKPFRVSSILSKLITIESISIENRQSGVYDASQLFWEIGSSKNNSLPFLSPYFAPVFIL